MKKILAVLCMLAMMICMFNTIALAEEKEYVLVDPTETLTSGEYIFVAPYKDKYYAADPSQGWKTKIESREVNITDGVIAAADATGLVWTVEVTDAGISVFDGTNYAGWAAANNWDKSFEAYYWEIVPGTTGFTFWNEDKDHAFSFRENLETGVLRWAPWIYTDENNAAGNFVYEILVFKAVADTDNGTDTGTDTGADTGADTGTDTTIDDTADINTAPLYTVLAIGIVVIVFASKKRFAK